MWSFLFQFIFTFCSCKKKCQINYLYFKRSLSSSTGCSYCRICNFKFFLLEIAKYLLQFVTIQTKPLHFTFASKAKLAIHTLEPCIPVACHSNRLLLHAQLLAFSAVSPAAGRLLLKPRPMLAPTPTWRDACTWTVSLSGTSGVFESVTLWH